MPTGIVKMFNNDRGYGFIQNHDGSGDVFVHIKNAKSSGIAVLAEGQTLSFDVKHDAGAGKSFAVNLAILR
jgi:CspA family cold shock protein